MISKTQVLQGLPVRHESKKKHPQTGGPQVLGLHFSFSQTGDFFGYMVFLTQKTSCGSCVLCFSASESQGNPAIVLDLVITNHTRRDERVDDFERYCKAYLLVF